MSGDYEAAVRESSPEESCPLCPSTGPPARSAVAATAQAAPLQTVQDATAISERTASQTSSFQIGFSSLQPTALPPTPPDTASPTDDDSYHWIACSNCDKWYHSVCVLLGGPEWVQGVPTEVRQEIEKNHQEEGAWTNWTEWVGRWYCKDCLQTEIPSTSSSRHHPLVATLKKGFPPNRKPKGASRSSQAHKRSSSAAHDGSAASPGTSIKRRRTAESQIAFSPDSMRARYDTSIERKPLMDRSGGLELGVNELHAGDDHGEGSSRSSVHSTPRGASQDPHGVAGEVSSRPKRQAALNRPDYHALHNHDAAPTSRWLDLITDPERYGATINADNFPRVPASLLTKEWIDSPTAHSPPTRYPDPDNDAKPMQPTGDYPPTLFYGAMREPLVVRKEDGGFEGMGGRLPSKDLTVADVARLVGPDVHVPVIDVGTQRSSQWPLSRWAEYVHLCAHPTHTASSPDMEVLRGKTYNIISLEITGTDLAKRVRPPRLVREVDWVDLFWKFGPDGKPGEVAALREEMDGTAVTAEGGGDVRNALTGKKGKGASWPKVQLYCLMGTKGSWTDWHVDFAASSVYYTVHTGAKTFFFIRPTEKNLKAYTTWCGSSELQHSTWLGSMCDDDVRKVTLRAGDTMIIPSGYIHAVYTPLDSIVFGGNFLHSYDIPTQLRLRQIEIDTKVPPMFRFPQLDKLCWYVAERYCGDLRQLRAYRPRSTTSPTPPHPRILAGLVYLAHFLSSQVAVLEDETAEDKARKSVYDKIPAEVVRDPAGLAKELLWRVERELAMMNIPIDMVDENGSEVKWNGETKEVRNGKNRVNSIKQRAANGTGLRMLSSMSRTDNFHPAPWNEHHIPVAREVTAVQLPRPSKEGYGRPCDVEEQANKEVKIRRQSRSRVRYLDDGRVVQEDQDVVFTETRISWPAPSGGGSSRPDVNGGGVHVEDELKSED